MSIDIPPALQWVSYLAGSKWPQGDEDGLWRMGELWHGSADEMSALIPDLNRVRQETTSVLTGETANTAEQEFAMLFDGDYSVDKLVAAMGALGEMARQAGTQVEASKIEILVGLAMAAAEILYAIAMAPWTFGISMSWIPVIEGITLALVRTLFNQLLRFLARKAAEALTKTAVSRLIREVAKETAEEVAEELITNLAIQQYQVDKGHKDSIDWGDVGDAAKGAAAGGAAAGAFHGPAHGLLGGKHGEGGIHNALAGAGASYGAEVAASIAGALAVGGNLDPGEIFAGAALGGLSGGIESSHGEHGDGGHGGAGPGPDGHSKLFGDGGKGPDGAGPDGTGAGNDGPGDKGSGNEGSGKDGPSDEGSGDKGSGEKGSENDGSGHEGSGEKGPGEKGPGNEGSGEKGSDDRGSESNGPKSNGSESRDSSQHEDAPPPYQEKESKDSAPLERHETNSNGSSDGSGNSNGSNGSATHGNDPSNTPATGAHSLGDSGTQQGSQGDSSTGAQSQNGHGDQAGTQQPGGSGGSNGSRDEQQSSEGQGGQQPSHQQTGSSQSGTDSSSHQGASESSSYQSNTESSNQGAGESSSNSTSDGQNQTAASHQETSPQQSATSSPSDQSGGTDRSAPGGESNTSSHGSETDSTAEQPHSITTSDTPPAGDSSSQDAAGHHSSATPSPPSEPPASNGSGSTTDPVSDHQSSADGSHETGRPSDSSQSESSQTNESNGTAPSTAPPNGGTTSGATSPPSNTPPSNTPPTNTPSTSTSQTPTPQAPPTTGTPPAGTTPSATPGASTTANPTAGATPTSTSNPTASPSATTQPNQAPAPTAQVNPTGTPAAQTNPTTSNPGQSTTPPSQTSSNPGSAASTKSAAGLGTSGQQAPTAVSNVASSTAPAAVPPAAKGSTNDDSQTQVVIGPNVVKNPDQPDPPTARRPRGSGSTPPPNSKRPPVEHDPDRAVIDDEAWRHDSSSDAPWFDAADPVSNEAIAARRDDSHVRTVDTEAADILTTSTPAVPDHLSNLIRYDLRRIEVEPGKFVQDFTVKLKLNPAPGVDADTRGDVERRAKDGVEALLNRGNRLPSGDQFHVTVEFTDTDPHATVELGNGDTDQSHWNTNASGNVMAHEVLHYLGVPDDHKAANRVFLQRSENSRVVPGGMMGDDLLGDDPRLRPRHLWLVERTANSQVSVPTSLLTDTAPPTVGPRTSHDGDGPARTVPAPTADTANPSGSPTDEQSGAFSQFGDLDVLGIRFESGRPLGGNSGVHEHEVNGRKVAIKPSKPQTAKTELLAQALFRATGAPTLRATPVLVQGQGDRIHLMSDMVNGDKPDKTVYAKFAGHPDVARFAAADMLLSNWDSHKNDAYITDGGRVVRLDVGGSLNVRAQGGARPGWTKADVEADDFVVEEIQPDSKMRGSGNGPFRDLSDHQVADSIRTVADRLTPDAIQSAIDESGYPPHEGQELKDVLEARIKKALEWADSVYPARELTNQSFGRRLGADAHASGASAHEDEHRSAHEQLEQDFGYRPKADLGDPDVVDALKMMDGLNFSEPFSEPKWDELPQKSVTVTSVDGSLAAEILGPPDFTLRPDVRGTNPEVGPEELLRNDQFGSEDERKQFAENSRILEGGVLIRRMSDEEVRSFETALASEDLDAIERALFPPDRKNPRGEIVWSVNDTYRFGREGSATGAQGSSQATAGQDSKGEDSTPSRHDPTGYQQILEIPVTGQMAKLLASTSYVNNPKDVAKPEAFKGNPTQKKEGAAGGAKDSSGVPNMVIKRHDFAGFWSTVQKIRVFDADAHVSAHKYTPPNETPEQRDERLAGDPDVAAKRQQRADRESPSDPFAGSDSDDEGGMLGLFGDESSTRGEPSNERPADETGSDGESDYETASEGRGRDGDSSADESQEKDRPQRTRPAPTSTTAPPVAGVSSTASTVGPATSGGAQHGGSDANAGDHSSSRSPGSDADERPSPPPAPALPPPRRSVGPLVRGGGAPPPLPRVDRSVEHALAADDSPRRGPTDDESWRHDPAESADWFDPRDPVSQQQWASRRDGAHVRTVDTVVADVETTSTPGRVDSLDGVVRYDLRRIEVAPGRFVQEYTVKVHLRPGAEVDSEAVERVRSTASRGVDEMLNRGFRLPSGDQFHVNLEFTDVAADAHAVVEVGNGGTDQDHWNPASSASVLAHETLHYLGVPDEYADARRVFLRHDTNSGVHRDDGGMMGADVLGERSGLRPRHLWLVERTANGQVSVPTSLLTDAGPPTAGPRTSHDGDASVRTRPAPSGERDRAPSDSADSAPAHPVSEETDEEDEDHEDEQDESFDNFDDLEPARLTGAFEDGPVMGGNSQVRRHHIEGQDQEVAIKPSSPRTARTELLAQALFRAAGAPTLRAKPVSVKGVVDKDGRPRIHLQSNLLNGKEPDKASHSEFAGHPDVTRFAAADMLLSNWDSRKNDSYIATGGRVVRIDVGGSLDRRAQGAIRPGWRRADIGSPDFDVDEIKPESRMRKGTKEKPSNGGPFENLTDKQVADSIRTVTDRLTPEAIDAAIRESGYPAREGAELKEVLQARMRKALEWADKVYPAVEMRNESFGEDLRSNAHADSHSDSDSDSADDEGESRSALQQLIDDFGYRPTRDLRDPAVIRALRSRDGFRSSNYQWGSDESQSVTVSSIDESDSPAVTALGPPAFTLNPDVRGINPEVGPEELLRDDQFGDDRLRRQFAENSRILEGSVLIRRVSDSEVEAFRAALASRDLNRIQQAIFRTGLAGSDIATRARGEVVWSINDAYRFDREGANATAPGATTAQHDPARYRNIIEIPVTAEMADLLARTSYVNNPSVGGRPEAFKGNAAQKKEGAAGGARNSAGVPNVVIRLHGFASFWSTLQKIRVFDADAHVSAHSYEPTTETPAERKERESKTPEALKKKAERAKKLSPHDLFEDDGPFGMPGVESEADGNSSGGSDSGGSVYETAWEGSDSEFGHSEESEVDESARVDKGKSPMTAEQLDAMEAAERERERAAVIEELADATAERDGAAVQMQRVFDEEEQGVSPDLVAAQSRWAAAEVRVQAAEDAARRLDPELVPAREVPVVVRVAPEVGPSNWAGEDQSSPVRSDAESDRAAGERERAAVIEELAEARAARDEAVEQMDRVVEEEGFSSTLLEAQSRWAAAEVRVQAAEDAARRVDPELVPPRSNADSDADADSDSEPGDAGADADSEADGGNDSEGSDSEFGHSEESEVDESPRVDKGKRPMTAEQLEAMEAAEREREREHALAAVLEELAEANAELFEAETQMRRAYGESAGSAARTSANAWLAAAERRVRIAEDAAFQVDPELVPSRVVPTPEVPVVVRVAPEVGPSNWAGEDQSSPVRSNAGSDRVDTEADVEDGSDVDDYDADVEPDDSDSDTESIAQPSEGDRRSEVDDDSDVSTDSEGTRVSEIFSDVDGSDDTQNTSVSEMSEGDDPLREQKPPMDQGRSPETDAAEQHPRRAATDDESVDQVPPKSDADASATHETLPVFGPHPMPVIPTMSGNNLVLSGMDVVETFRSGDQGVDQIRQLIIEHGGQQAWADNRQRVTALFADDKLKPKVAGMLRGGKPVELVVELGEGRTLAVALRLDGTPTASSLKYSEIVPAYEFEHNANPSSFTGSVDERRRAQLAGVQTNLIHPNATYGGGIYGRREHQWSTARTRTDRQIGEGTTTEEATRFAGTIVAVTSYRLRGANPLNRNVASGSLPPVSFDTEVAVPTRAVEDGARPAPASTAPPRIAETRALTGSDAVTNLHLLADAGGPRSTTDFVTSAQMRSAFATAYGSDADAAMNQVDAWLDVDLLQANLHAMTNKQPLVRHLEGIGGRVEVHAFVESLDTPEDPRPEFGEHGSNTAAPQVRFTGETASTEFHSGTETDSARSRQDQVTYTAQLPLPGAATGRGGTDTGEVVGGLEGAMGLSRSTNETTSSQYRQRNTVKQTAKGQALNGQVRLRFVLHGPGSVSPQQPDGKFRSAVIETRGRFDALAEKSQNEPTVDYRGTDVHAPPARIWARGERAGARNSTTRRSRWRLGAAGTTPASPASRDSADPTPRQRGEIEPLTGLGSMDRVRNLDLGGFHGMVESMGRRAFGSSGWAKASPRVDAAGHIDRVRAGMAGMTQGDPLTLTQLAGPKSTSSLSLTADIVNLTYRRTLDDVMSSPSTESTRGSTTTATSTQQIAEQVALGGRGGNVAGGMPFGQAIAGASNTSRDGSRQRTAQRFVVGTKFDQPMAVFDGWVRIDGTMAGPKATVHESGLFPIEIAIPLSELQGSRRHDAQQPPTFNASNPAGFVGESPAATRPDPEPTPPVSTRSAEDVDRRRQEISADAYTNKPGSAKRPWYSTTSVPTAPAPPPSTSQTPPLDDLADHPPGSRERPAETSHPALTWTPPTPADAPNPPAHALGETWQPTDVLVGLDPASGLASAIRADLAPMLGADVDAAMSELAAEFGPQVLQARVAHESGQQWSHRVSVTGGSVVVKVRAIREGTAEFVGHSTKFETDVSVEAQAATARLQDDLNRHVEGAQGGVPFPHGMASARGTHTGSIPPKPVPSAGRGGPEGSADDLVTERAETRVTETEGRTPTRVRSAEEHDLFRQPIRFEISYEAHGAAKLSKSLPSSPDPVRLAGVFAYPSAASVEVPPARVTTDADDRPEVRLDPSQVVSEVRPPVASPLPAAEATGTTAVTDGRTPDEDAMATHVLDSMADSGREVFGSRWPAVRAELAAHVGTHGLQGGLGRFSRGAEQTVELKSVPGGTVVLGARVDDVTEPVPAVADKTEVYGGGVTITNVADANADVHNWALTAQAQGTVLPADVGANAVLLGRIDVSRTADSTDTRTGGTATGELFRKKAAGTVQAGRASVHARMSRPGSRLGGPGREATGTAPIEFRTRQSAPDGGTDRYEPTPGTVSAGRGRSGAADAPGSGLPRNGLVGRIDGEEFRSRTREDLGPRVGGIAAARLRDRLPAALTDVALQRHLPAMTRGEEVELLVDGRLRVTGRAELTGLDFTRVESEGTSANLLNEVNLGQSHQDASGWEGAARFMAGVRAELDEELRGDLMAGGGGTESWRHGTSQGQGAKIAANAKIAQSRAIFAGTARIVLTVYDGETPYELSGVDVRAPMSIPTSELLGVPADTVRSEDPPPPPPPPARELPAFEPPRLPPPLTDFVPASGTAARLSRSRTGSSGYPITTSTRLRRLLGRGPVPTPFGQRVSERPTLDIEMTDFGDDSQIERALGDAVARVNRDDSPRRDDA